MEEIKRISYSELKNWKECPYRHKLTYIDKIESFVGNEFTAFGTSIHAACEESIPKNIENPIKIFEESFKLEIQKLKDLNVSLDFNLIEEMRLQAIPICEQILPAIKNNFKDFQVFSVEEELLEPITEFESFNKNFKGFIDLVLKTSDGNYHIIDWKTCSWGWSSYKKSDALTNYQLTYYKNYFSKKHNVEPSKINTYFALLKRTAKKNNVEILKVSSGAKKIDNSLKVLQNAVINIEKGTSIKNRLNCKYCNFYKTEHCT